MPTARHTHGLHGRPSTPVGFGLVHEGTIKQGDRIYLPSGGWKEVHAHDAYIGANVDLAYLVSRRIKAIRGRK